MTSARQQLVADIAERGWKDLAQLAEWRDKVCTRCGRSSQTVDLNIEAAIHHGTKLECLDRTACARRTRKHK